MSLALRNDGMQYLQERIQQLPDGGLVERALFTALGILGAIPRLQALAKYIGGRIHYVRGNYPQAEHWLLEALSAGRQGHARTHNYLGRTQSYLGHFEEAEANHRRAIEASPHMDVYYFHMAQALRRQGRHEEEEPYLHKALALKPRAAYYHFCLFQNELARLGAGPALDAWLDRVSATPDMEEPVINPDWWLVHRDAYTPQRLEKVRALLAQHPDSSDCHLLLAYLLRYSENPAAGIPHLQAASRQRWERIHGRDSGVDFTTAKPPAFMVIGLAKAGSSSLYTYLCMHPLISPAIAKEINFWTDHYKAGNDWYQACFPPIPVTSPHISGEASIKTFWYPDAPATIAHDCPDMKLILILREPVERAFSDYNMHVRLGREERSWRELVEQQLERLPECPVEENDYPAWSPGEARYLVKSAVLPVLKRWLRHHHKDKLLVIDNRDLGRDTTATMNRVFEFLGLPAHDIVAPPRLNIGGYRTMDREIYSRLQAWYQPHEEALREFLRREIP